MASLIVSVVKTPRLGIISS